MTGRMDCEKQEEYVMSEKDRHLHTAVENHAAAPLADAMRVKRVSQVTIPGRARIKDAKEYVDGNQK